MRMSRGARQLSVFSEVSHTPMDAGFIEWVHACILYHGLDQGMPVIDHWHKGDRGVKNCKRHVLAAR